jgi:peptide/nickel transport system ATP-binding protein
VVGESGSGKSTLAHTLLRLTEPTSGTIFFCGSEFTALNKQELRRMRKHLQIVFQNPASSLNLRRTCGELIYEVLAFHKMAEGPLALEKRAVELFTQVGLDPSFLRRYSHELSVGQQQRVCIARALATQPQLLVLDECLSALDVSIQAQVLNLLLELHQSLKLSYLFISHNLGVVEHLSDNVLVMQKGRIVEQGPVEQVFSEPAHPYTRLLISSRLSSFPR